MISNKNFYKQSEKSNNKSWTEFIYISKALLIPFVLQYDAELSQNQILIDGSFLFQLKHIDGEEQSAVKLSLWTKTAFPTNLAADATFLGQRLFQIKASDDETYFGDFFTPSILG